MERKWGTYSGNIILGDVEAADWKRILHIVNRIDGGIELLPIKSFIIKNIEIAKRRAMRERERQFLSKY